jgi:hypothetical protein
MGRSSACPSCKRAFVNERALKSHLFHRSSKCKQFLPHFSQQNELEIMSDTLDIRNDTQCYILNQENIEENHAPDISMTDRFAIWSLYYFWHWNHTSFEEEEYVELFTRPNNQTGIYSEAQSNFYMKIQLEDQHAKERANNPFWPFSCFVEWEVVQFLENLGISQEKKDEFLCLKYVCH